MGSILTPRFLVLLVLLLASTAIAVPTSFSNTAVTRNRQLTNDTFPDVPHANRTIVEQMDAQATDDGILPECYKKCMKSESGKGHTDINELTVEGWCCDSAEFFNAQRWLNNYVFPCVKYECAENLSGKVGRARAWMRDTCGPTIVVGAKCRRLKRRNGVIASS